jgi:ubiquitin-conjugating enzyme E2 T
MQKMKGMWGRAGRSNKAMSNDKSNLLTSLRQLFTMPMNPATKARLMREMSLLSKDPPPGIAAYTPNPADMTQIRAQITGPEGSPFETGVFLLTVHITARYPFEPPRCRFLTPLYHPNVDSHGRICLDTLKSPPAGSWSPAVSMPSLLLSIRSLMAEPNPDDGLVPEISELYKRNPAQWTKEAERRTKLDATVEKLEQLESDEKETKHDDNVKNEKEASTNIIAATGSNNNNSNSDKNVQKKAASSITNNNDANPLEDSSESKRKFKKLKSSK